MRLIDAIACVLQCAQVAREGGWIAGDVDDLRGGDAAEESAGFEARAGARRIENDKVWAFALRDGLLQEGECGLGDGAMWGTKFLECRGEIGGGDGAGFDGCDLREIASKDAGEEA